MSYWSSSPIHPRSTRSALCLPTRLRKSTWQPSTMPSRRCPGIRPAEHTQHSGRLHFIHRNPGHRRVLPDPDSTKVAQIGVLKAIGTSNPVVAAAAVIQIVVITVIGVAIGGLLTFLFSLSFPPQSRLSLTHLVGAGDHRPAAHWAVRGLLSIRYAVQIGAAQALGLSS